MIYADANIIIRLIEGDTAVRAPIEARLLPFKGSGPFLLTSRLTQLECRVMPLRNADSALLQQYDLFFNSAEVRLLEVSREVIEKATELRATLNLKTPDAIHVASAITAKANELWTGDKGIIRCKDIHVEVF